MTRHYRYCHFLFLLNLRSFLDFRDFLDFPQSVHGLVKGDLCLASLLRNLFCEQIIVAWNLSLEIDAAMSNSFLWDFVDWNSLSRICDRWDLKCFLMLDSKLKIMVNCFLFSIDSGRISLISFILSLAAIPLWIMKKHANTVPVRPLPQAQWISTG